MVLSLPRCYLLDYLQYKTESKEHGGQVPDGVSAVPVVKRVVIVTGAGGGLGRAYALDLAARGWRVIVNNRRREIDAAGLGSAQRVVREILDAGGEAIASEVDVLDGSSGAAMLAQAMATWGRLDALVANAGVDQHLAFHKISIDQFKAIFDVNFYGTLYSVHACYAHMRSAGWGRIVVSTSSAGLHGLHGLSAYSASKAALIGLIRSIAAEGRSHQVLCNAVAPYAATRMTEAHSDATFIAAMRPHYVAPLVAFLLSDHCAVSGQTLVAGGGGFRRAAMVEAPGVHFAEPGKVTPEALAQQMEHIGALSGATEFPDALEAFRHFMQQQAQATG
jgi:NAD(P)-dependent dehydrogenase (short-subunit alcohol dehydrogenase family)